MPAASAAIFGCSGLVLTDEERRFFERTNPLGFILFARNVDSPAQVKALVESLRACVGRADAPVLMTGPATTVFRGEIDIPENL